MSGVGGKAKEVSCEEPSLRTKAKTMSLSQLHSAYHVREAEGQNVDEKEYMKVEDHNKDKTDAIEELIFEINEYALEDDSKLTKDAQDLKQELLKKLPKLRELEPRLNRIKLFIEKEKFWASDTWVVPYYGLQECLGKEIE